MSGTISGRGGDLGVERAEAQLVLLVAELVGRVGQPAVVVADGRAADGEVVRALGQHVLVEQDLLLLAGLTGRGQLVGGHGRGAGSGCRSPCPPRCASSTTTGPRRVGTDMSVSLIRAFISSKRPVRRRGERGRLLLGVGVLGLQVGQDLGVLALAEPEPGVLAVVAVGRDDMGAPGCAGGAGHRMESLPRLATRQCAPRGVSAGPGSCYYLHRGNSPLPPTSGATWPPRISTSGGTSSGGATPRTTSSSPRRA